VRGGYAMFFFILLSIDSIFYVYSTYPAGQPLLPARSLPSTVVIHQIAEGERAHAVLPKWRRTKSLDCRNISLLFSNQFTIVQEKREGSRWKRVRAYSSKFGSRIFKKKTKRIYYTLWRRNGWGERVGGAVIDETKRIVYVFACLLVPVSKNSKSR